MFEWAKSTSQSSHDASFNEQKLHVIATNVYQELGASHLKVASLGAAQLCLFSFYLLALDSTTPDFTDGRTFLFCYFGIVLQVVLALTPCPWASLYEERSRFWTLAIYGFMASEDGTACCVREGIEERARQSPFTWARHFCDMFVNQWLRLLLILSLPQFLCTSSGYVSFIRNSAALLYVLSLDDLPMSRRYTFRLRDMQLPHYIFCA